MKNKDISSVLAEELFNGSSVEAIAERHDLSVHDTVIKLLYEDRYVNSEELKRHCELVKVEPLGEYMVYTYLMKEMNSIPQVLDEEVPDSCD